MNSRAETEQANKALVQRWFEEVWNQGRPELIDEFRASDAVTLGLAHPDAAARGNDAFKNFYFNFREAFPDLRGEINDIMAEGDRVVARLTFEATHLGHSLGIPPTHRKVRFGFMGMTRLMDGKIVETWNNIDYLAILEQIGAVAESPFRQFFAARVTPQIESKK